MGFQYRLAFLVIAAVLALPLFAKQVSPEKVKLWTERKLFAAKNSTEAKLKFHHRVQFVSETEPSKYEALNAIDRQLWHLFGPLSEAKQFAAPKNEHKITKVSKPALVEGYSDLWTVTYHYEGVLQIKNGDDENFRLILPVNPDLLYEASRVGKKYPCTDDHYDSLGDFWYFWNPKKPGCKLAEGNDYERVKPDSFERIANTELTYPDYPRLVTHKKSGTAEIRIDFLLGLDEPELNPENLNPLLSEDINAETYRDIRSSLLKEKYVESEPWSRDRIRQVAALPKSELKHLPYVQEFEKTSARGIVIKIRLFFGPSGITEDGNAAFHYFYKDALENASVMLYDGHSGLGGHLDIEAIQDEHDFEIKFNPNYQIYFFNSCTSYTYYNASYFAFKARRGDPLGIKGLDILANGLATSFYVLHKTNLALILAIDGWANKKTPYRSYQDLARSIDSSNLFSVNGDEDNPTNAKALK